METTVAPPPTKGRPREFCVDMALAAALRVFWSKGYEGASMTDLTEAMGITRPSLYAAFGNKERLFLKVIERYSDGPGGYLLDMLESPDAREAVRSLLDKAADLQTGKGLPRDHPRGCLIVNATAARAECTPEIQRDLMGQHGRSVFPIWRIGPEPRARPAERDVSLLQRSRQFISCAVQ